MNSINNIKIKNDDSSFSVIVIGAGIAGISCARKLYKKGINVLIVEASDDIGGRVKKEENWLDWKILDLGAEFIHGSKTKLKKYCDKYGIATRKMFTWAQGDGHTSKYPVWGEMSMYYIGKDKKLLRWDTKDPDVKKVNDLLWSLWKIDEIPDDKKTLKQYLKDHHISENGIALAEAGYANTVCSSLDFLPLNSVIRLEKAWLRDGGGDYRLHYGMMTVINHMAKNLKIKLNWPVKTINYQDDQKIILINNKGEKLSANIIVITVPLLILKHGDIGFIPPLPEDKQLCIKTFNVYNAIKIVMKFSKRFWPVQLQGIICSDCFIPELWFDEPNRVGALSEFSPKLPPTKLSNSPSFTVSGFCTCKAANIVSKMTKEEIIKKMLEQLDEIFGNKDLKTLLIDTRDEAKYKCEQMFQDINPSNPASLYFLDCLIVNWEKNSYIKGGYSSPSFGETINLRKSFSIPIKNKIFFAGEATHYDSYMSLHGAMETGKNAASSILKQLSSTLSSKL